MQAVIGQRLLSRLKPQPKPYEVRDQQLKGFMLRVQPSGHMTYLVQYGRGKRVTLGQAGALKPNDARIKAQRILGGVIMGIDPKATEEEPERTAPMTLREFIEEEYAPWAEVNIKTYKGSLRRLELNFSNLMKKELDAIEPHAVERWRTRRFKQGLKPASVNRDLVCLKAVLSKAVEWGRIETHPIARVKPSKVDDNEEPRFLSKAEAARLMQALDDREERIRAERASGNQWRAERDLPMLPDLYDCAFADHLKPMVILSLYTGLRRGELFNLTWKDVSFEQARVTVRGGGAKSGKTRHIPLNDVALEVITDWWEQCPSSKGLVFVGKKGGRFDNVSTAWNALRIEADLGDFRWHDMRHTFASWLVMAGVDLNTVRELMGHADLKMTLRYAHLAPEHKASAVQALL